MNRRTSRWLTWLAMILGGATMFQSIGFTNSGLNSGCARFGTNGILSATNFCVLLDCEDGFFGGVVDPCQDPSQAGTLLDCEPVFTTNGGTGTVTDTTTTDTNQLLGL
ncbi:MAG: hypothetical protein JSV03_03415 [Planctomycetota bacterium]|nr:MAG: hypothetical protein JSV03_03415 [Planctomycetota bacterium]